MKYGFIVTVLIGSASLIAGCSSAPELNEFNEHGASCDLCKRACASRATSPTTYNPSIVLNLGSMVEACEKVIKEDPSCKIPKDCVDAVEEEVKNARKQADGMFLDGTLSTEELVEALGIDAN